jgi:hypothetical protein
MKTLQDMLDEQRKGLWDNIHAKRARGEKMRKPGSEGAPTDQALKDAQGKKNEEVEALDELSDNTLKSYKSAAHKSIGKNAVDRHAGNISSKEYHKTADKRGKGINKADKRLGTYADKTPKKLDISAHGETAYNR